MEVILAEHAGFCFGVTKAVDTVYEQIKNNPGMNIYTYGPIIHNEIVVKDMVSMWCSTSGVPGACGVSVVSLP